MPFAQPPDQVASFTEELLRTGLTFIDVSSELIEGLEPEHYPGEDTGAGGVEMLTGSKRGHRPPGRTPGGQGGAAQLS